MPLSRLLRKLSLNPGACGSHGSPDSPDKEENSVQVNHSWCGLLDAAAIRQILKRRNPQAWNYVIK